MCKPRSTAPFRVGGRRQGLSFLYVVVMMILLIAFVAFAVDVGRMRLARAQLQTAADAAARAGASALPYPESADPFNRAVEIAALNKCLSDPIALDKVKDIELGIWHPGSRTFSTVSSGQYQEADAVHVTTRRIASRNNAVKLYFAAVLGFFQNDIETDAIAYIQGNPTTGYGIVGLDFISSNGNHATIDSYKPPNYNATKENKGSVLTKGYIDLGNGDILGDARAAGSITTGPNGTITGWEGPLDQPLPDFPSPTVPSGAPPVSSKGKILTVSSGTQQTNQAGQLRTINFTGTTGVTNLYVTGNLGTSGNATWGDSQAPGRLRIYMVTPGSTINIGGNANVYAEIYAPNSTYTMQGNTQLYGSLVAKSISFKGTADVHYDESNLWGVPSGYTIRLVK